MHVRFKDHSRLPHGVAALRRFLVAALAGVSMAMASQAAAQQGTIYLEMLTLDAQNHPSAGAGLRSWFSGPFVLDMPLGGIATADVGGVSPHPELLLFADQSIFTIDLVAGAGSVLMPPPPKAPTAMVAIPWLGSPEPDIVIAAGASLYLLDPHASAPMWLGPFPMPLSVASLAGVNVSGSAEPELVASDGAQVLALDPGQLTLGWQALPPPPVAPQSLRSVDLGIAGTFPHPVAGLRLLAADADGASYVYVAPVAPGQPPWAGPVPRRFHTVAGAPLNVRAPLQPALGDLVLTDPLNISDIRFENITTSMGLDEPLQPGGDGHCPGAVFTDIDVDGWPDVYLVRGFGEGEHAGNRLFMGSQGQGFEAAEGAAGAFDARNGAGALAGDFDNDGDRDLYVINFDDRNSFYRNDGGVFVDATDATDPTPADFPGDLQEGLGVAISTSRCEPGEPVPCALDDSLSAAAGDFNRDGWLDLYVGNHLCCDFPEGERDVLYINRRDGTFLDLTLATGVGSENPPGGQRATQAVMIADFNNDRWPDIYVTNKGNGPTRDQLFLNDGDADGDGWDGRFTEWFQGQPEPLGSVTGAAMGIDVADFDNDGDLDVFLTDIGKMDLYRNRLAEDGSFSLELVTPSPVAAPDFNWGATWADFDNDGLVDLHVASNDGDMNWLYRNKGGDDFVDVALDAGTALASNSRASVTADFDRDGRMDLLVVNRGDAPVALYHNQTQTVDNWLQVQLEGDPHLPGAYRSTRDAVGAHIEVITAGVTQRRDIHAGGHTCGSSGDYVALFGIGNARLVDELRVRWSSGRVSVRRNLNPNQLLKLREQDASF